MFHCFFRTLHENVAMHVYMLHCHFIPDAFFWTSSTPFNITQNSRFISKLAHKSLSLLWKNTVHRIWNPGRAVAQAVRRWLPTAAARVSVRAACGVCGGQSGSGAGFLRVLRFPLPIIPPISPSSKSPEAGTIGVSMAAVPSGPNWTPPPHTNLI
jgi:hypothetical protein